MNNYGHYPVVVVHVTLLPEILFHSIRIHGKEQTDSYLFTCRIIWVKKPGISWLGAGYAHLK